VLARPLLMPRLLRFPRVLLVTRLLRLAGVLLVTRLLGLAGSLIVALLRLVRTAAAFARRGFPGARFVQPVFAWRGLAGTPFTGRRFSRLARRGLMRLGTARFRFAMPRVLALPGRLRLVTAMVLAAIAVAGRRAIAIGIAAAGRRFGTIAVRIALVAAVAFEQAFLSSGALAAFTSGSAATAAPTAPTSTTTATGALAALSRRTGAFATRGSGLR